MFTISTKKYYKGIGQKQNRTGMNKFIFKMNLENALLQKNKKKVEKWKKWEDWMKKDLHISENSYR